MHDHFESFRMRAAGLSDGAGRVRLALRHAWSDGTTHLEFDPVALLERLAVLVPRPRVNLMCALRRPAAADRPHWGRAS